VSEWWTYRPSDFLMFSPRIYWRLFQSLSEAWWPAQPIVVAVGLTWLALHRRLTRETGAGVLRGAVAFVAVCWAVVGWAFLQQRFASINWIAGWFAALFAVQAAALLMLAIAGELRCESHVLRRRVGTALGLWVLLGHPLLGVVFGRPWQQAEIFGLAPDPTAIGTLALMLLFSAANAPARWLHRMLWIVPLLWCAFSAATLATMGSSQAWVVLAGAILAVAPLLRPSDRRN